MTVRKEQMPKLAVHFLIMRGRLAGSVAGRRRLDQGKPVTIAATKWITVKPVKNIVTAALGISREGTPGEEVESRSGSPTTPKPVAGEATF